MSKKTISTDEKKEGYNEERDPKYMFSCTDSSLLIAGVKGEINFIALAKRRLAQCGLDDNGKWIGFHVAEKFWNEAI